MGTYGRNADFLQSPLPQHRLGRYKTGAAAIAQFAPVLVDTGVAVDAKGRQTLVLAIGEQARPHAGQGGICVYEVDDANYRGQDPMLTRPSDIVEAPAATPVQLVYGSEVRIRLVNTEDFSFDGQRDYEGRTMVAGASGATPTVEVGEYLTPGVGDATDGFWAVTADEANGWFLVTGIDTDTGEVDAQCLIA